jgi:hypothetical protein
MKKTGSLGRTLGELDADCCISLGRGCATITCILQGFGRANHYCHIVGEFSRSARAVVHTPSSTVMGHRLDFPVELSS